MRLSNRHLPPGFVGSLVVLPILAIVASAAPPPVNSVVRMLSSANPAVQGQNVTLTTGPNYTANALPTGTITVTDTVTCAGASSTTVQVLGIVTLGSADSATPGAGTLVVSSFPCVGDNSLVASYGGDANYTAADSQPLVETVLAQFTPTTTLLSATPTSVSAGQTVTFSAVLNYGITNNTYPTGAVTFIDTTSGNVLGAANVQTSGSGTRLGTGAALATSLVAGSYNVQASYSGNNIYSPSTSQVMQLIVGPGVPPKSVIESVVTTQGDRASQNVDIAPNTWIEIHGTNLAPVTKDWSNEDFSHGLPTILGGVSATVNNKPAAISYISATQVNILTPLDDALGPVPLQLNTPYGNANLMTPLMLQITPSFLVLDGAGHVAARHARDFSLVGPPSSSVPGYTFTPAKPGETISLYAVGFGQTNPPISNPLVTAAAPLPVLPNVTIGGLPATVSFAGLVQGAGLYQINVIVPIGASDGDLIVSATYNGSATQSSVILTVQH
jgi:uncharacterized protein (TIGR03437 family)